jgi:hypothetical protein
MVRTHYHTLVIVIRRLDHGMNTQYRNFLSPAGCVCRLRARLFGRFSLLLNRVREQSCKVALQSEKTEFSWKAITAHGIALAILTMGVLLSPASHGQEACEETWYSSNAGCNFYNSINFGSFQLKAEACQNLYGREYTLGDVLAEGPAA